MGFEREFSIAYRGLKNGTYSFEFAPDTRFFKKFDKSSIKEGTFKVVVDLDRKENLMTLHFNIVGSYSAPCDRCLKSIQIPVKGKDRMFVKFDEEERMEDEIIYLNPQNSWLDLSTAIYEMIHVHMPMNHVIDCESRSFQDCDHEILEKMRAENASRDKDLSIWSELKKLKL